ncbi:hypothetical protein [Roseomonas indoligenes]|uniref:Elements of external origin n=1 Tax=Roseomonas indoligenes TaxID=2820811 RepID=A0A940S5E7_9PROT|nr:hypothetical protein [Pararoseomonas indoligenes]MBP0492865.1 hypothetical protein [Pararoseomonas indoligenes]
MSAPLSADTSSGISIREFARREGCDDKLVRRAVQGGKLQAFRDGTLNPALVGSGWRKSNRHPAPGADTPADSGADTAADTPRMSAPVRTPVSAPPPAPPAHRMEPQLHGGELRRPTKPEADEPDEEIDLEGFQRDVLAGNVPDLARSEKVKAAAAAIRGMVAARRDADAVVELGVAEAVMFETFRGFRDAWMNWPARVAPLIAADLGIDAGRVLEALTPHVQQQLEDLGEPEPDFTPPDEE